VTPQDCAALLSLAAKYDPRLGERTTEDALLATKAWAAALNPNMSHTFATDAIIRHYARNTDRVTPAHINVAFATYVRDQAHRSTLNQVTSHTGVPPTAEYLAAKAALWPDRYPTKGDPA
jgi:hypothetical protein